MVQGCRINMDNKSALTTVAMLSTFSSHKGMDYLDLITPFVLSLLPNIDEKIDTADVLKRLNEEYGFEDLPTNVLLKILIRNSKTNIGILSKENNDFYVRKPIDLEDFRKNKINMKEDIENIIDSLKKNLEDKTQIKDINFESSQKMLIGFLYSYGYVTINDIDSLREMTIVNDRNNYYVARFILQEYNRESSVFDKILELIKGFLIYKAIYFFSSNQKKEFNSQLKGTEIYLDTSLLISALGYDREEEKYATRELISLIIDNGGVVKTFNHNKVEVIGILTKFAMDIKARPNMRLEFLVENKYNKDDVLRLRNIVEENLEQQNILVVDKPSYGTVKDNDFEDKGYLDLQELKSRLQQRITYRNEEDEVAVENDVDSISSISRIRKTEESCSIEDCKAIFITTNLGIVSVVNELYRERFSKGEIPFVISDIDLTSLLWLNNFNKINNIPCLKLISSVYAAHQPTKEVMDNFNRQVSILEKEGTITSEMAIIFRTDTRIKDNIVEITENDPEKMTSDMLNKMKDKYEEEIKLEDKVTIKKLEKENDELINLRERKATAYSNAEVEAKEYARGWEKLLKIFFKAIFTFLIILGGILTIQSYLSEKNKLTIGLLLLIFSILGIIDSSTVRLNYINKLIEKISNNIFDYKYHKKVEDLNKIFK